MTISQVDVQPALIDQVHDRLLAALVDGTLAPGRRLTQDEIAQMLGVSRQPVSHAIQVLRRRGLRVDAGRRGVAVAPIDAQRIRDLYQVRAAIDGLAAELAAERCRSGTATRAEVAALKTAAMAGSQELASARRPSLALLVEADVAFHSALHRLSGNAAIAETVAEQWPHFRRTMLQVLEGSSEVVRRVWREHAAIAEAVAAGKVSEAGSLARAHASRAAEETLRRLAPDTGLVPTAPVKSKPKAKRSKKEEAP